jgi:hypothetical protein
MDKTIKNFIQTGRFKHNRSEKNGVDIEKLYRNAYTKLTPYVAFNKEYSKEYGLAKLSIYNDLI